MRTRRWVKSWAIVVAVLTGTGSISADLVTVANPGFESTALGEGNSTSAVTGWLAFSTSVMNPSAVQFPGGATTEGLNAAMLAPGSLIIQNLTSVLQFGTYTIEFDLGNRLDADYAGMNLVFKAGGVGMLASTSFVPTPGDGLFDTAVFSYLASPSNVNGGFVGGLLRLEFLPPSGSSGITALDNIRVNFTAIPEPAGGLAGMLLGVTGLIFRRRKGIGKRDWDGCRNTPEMRNINGVAVGSSWGSATGGLYGGSWILAFMVSAVMGLMPETVSAQPPPPGTLIVDYLPPHDYSPTGSGFLISGNMEINGSGQVGGGFTWYEAGADTGSRPVRWDYGLGYQFQEMNTPPASWGGYVFAGAGINSGGSLAGHYVVYDSAGNSVESRATRWIPGSTAPDDLDHLFPAATTSNVYDINDGGAVIGRTYVGDLALGQRPVRWDAGTTTPTELGVLGFSSTGSTTVNALGLWINNAGTATGNVTKYSSTGAYQGWRAVRWDAGSNVAVELAAPPGLSWTVPDLFAQGINEAGMVYGKLWDTPGLTYRGVRWDAAGNGTLLEATSYHGAAVDETEQEVTAMNLSGTVVGVSNEFDAGNDLLGAYAVKWGAGSGTPTVLTQIDTYGNNYSISGAFAINDAGTIGGYSTDFDNAGNEFQQAVVWMPDGTIVNLNTMPIASLDGSGGSWVLQRIETMAADGWAAGWGLFDADGTGTAHEGVSTNWSAQLGFGGVVIGGLGAGGAMRWGDGNNWSTGTPALEIGRAIFSHAGLREMFLDRIVRTQGVDLEAGETSLDVGGHELSVDERIRIFNGARLNLRTTYDLGNELVGHVFAHILNEGTFSPGNSPGLLNLIGDFDNTGVMEFEITGTGERLFDELWIDGEFGAGGTLRLVLEGYTPVLGDEFDLIDWNALDWQGMVFDFSAAPLTSGLDWDTSAFQTSGLLRVGSAIPEPASGLFLLPIALFMTVRSRSRR